MESTEEGTRSDVEAGIRALSGKQSRAKRKTQSCREKKKNENGKSGENRRAGAETCSLKDGL